VSNPDPLPSVDDAIQFLIRYIRSGQAAEHQASRATYGYEIYIRAVLAAYLIEKGASPGGTIWGAVEGAAPKLSPIFGTAAWTLARRGILRPGTTHLATQSTDEGGGWGFSVTPVGKEWIAAAPGVDYLPIEGGRFGRLLAERGEQFGGGFVERSQVAVRAYDAQAYLACCSMCGAAAESIILRLAVDKTGDEAATLKDYEAGGGRGRVERKLIGSLPSSLQAEFRRYTDLLKHWRDSASHGRAIHMTEAEAFGALILLLRFTIFAAEHRAEIVGSSSAS
jgi:hypothetical protein